MPCYIGQTSIFLIFHLLFENFFYIYSVLQLLAGFPIISTLPNFPSPKLPRIMYSLNVTHTCTHIHIRTHTFIHIHTNTYIHIYTHHIPSESKKLVLLKSALGSELTSSCLLIKHIIPRDISQNSWNSIKYKTAVG